MSISGETIILYEQNTTGKDDFNRDITEEIPVTIENVVIGRPTTDDMLIIEP